MKILKLLFAGASLVLLTSCATSKGVEKRIHTEVKNETVVKSEDVAINAREYVMKSNNLSAEQKTSLLAFQEKTLNKAKSINEKINQTKMVLIKKLMEPTINQKEVSILKKELSKLSKNQMETSLSAFDEACKIIAPIKNREDKEYLFNTFMMKQNNSFQEDYR